MTIISIDVINYQVRQWKTFAQMVQSHSNHTPQNPKQYSQCNNSDAVTYKHVTLVLSCSNLDERPVVCLKITNVIQNEVIMSWFITSLSGFYYISSEGKCIQLMLLHTARIKHTLWTCNVNIKRGGGGLKIRILKYELYKIYSSRSSFLTAYTMRIICFYLKWPVRSGIMHWRHL